MRLAADRLGRGRLGLTQRDGDEAQEGGGICSDLHVDFRNVVAGSTEWERAARWMSEWVGGATTINAGCERYMKRPRRPTVARCNQPGTKNKPRSEVPYTAGIDSACRQGAPPPTAKGGEVGRHQSPSSLIHLTHRCPAGMAIFKDNTLSTPRVRDAISGCVHDRTNASCPLLVRPTAWCFRWPTFPRCLAVGWCVMKPGRKGTAEGGGWPSRCLVPLAIKVRSSKLRAAKAASGPIRCGAFFSYSSTTAATRPSTSIFRWTRVPRWASTLYLTRVGPVPLNFAVYRRRAHSFPPSTLALLVVLALSPRPQRLPRTSIPFISRSNQGTGIC
jgi:hypothetical protein